MTVDGWRAMSTLMVSRGYQPLLRDITYAYIINGIKDILAGSIRGIAQVMVGHPLDTIKVRLQTQSATAPRYNGVFHCFSATINEEGTWGFYKRGQSPVLMCAVYSAVLFLSYGQAKNIFHPDTNSPFTVQEMLKIGTVCAISAATVESPMDMVKAKMQVQYNGYTGKPSEYRSSVHCAQQLYKNYGMRSLFRGYDAAITRNLIGTPIYFYSYEQLRYVLSGDDVGDRK